MRSSARKIGEPWDVHLTYEDYCELPDDGRRYELIDGELLMNPAPSTAHQRVSRNLEFILHAHVRKARLGAIYNAPIDVVLAEDTVVQPDLVFVSSDRLHLVQPQAIEGAPDLVVEILSPRSVRTDRARKASLYAKHRIQEYWIVDPASETIDVLVLKDEGYVLHAAIKDSESYVCVLLDGLEIPLREVFAPDL